MVSKTENASIVFSDRGEDLVNCAKVVALSALEICN